MRSALFASFFVLLVFEQVASQSEIPKKSPVRGRFTRSVDNFKVVVPKKVTRDGDFVSHYLPHFYTLEDQRESSSSKRKKRDVDDDEVHYVVPIDGVDHHLELTPHSSFISPGLVIEEHESDVRVNKDGVKLRNIRSTQCHFKGVVRGKLNSKVAISTCYGLTGHIRTGEQEYLIEPVDDEDSGKSGTEHEHIIFKREDVRGDTNCGTQSLKKEVTDNIKNEKKEKRTCSLNTNGTSLSLKRSCIEPCCNQREVWPIGQGCLPDKPIFLELMVTVDNSVRTGFPRLDVDQYILTMVNMVVLNFQDDTIGIPINVKLVRVLYLGFEYPELDVLRFDHQDLLKNFCVWQKVFNPFKESHPSHHDYAVYITRFKPCQGHVLGVTNQRGMCHPDKSCGVVSNEGLLLANILTHQIGHSLGAEHDEGSEGGCSPQEPDGTRYHMASFITLSSSEWSVCSKESIMNFVQSENGLCLTDIPTDYNYKFPDMVPGQIYTATEQCTFSFHMNSLACRTGNICELLYCQVSSKLCISSGDPPALGTPCARNMWCFRGSCVHRGQRPGSINGAWSEWSKWTPCSRSCGGGVQSAYRTCTNPAPRYGGRSCLGSWLKHRMCSIKPCDGYTVPFLTVQCKMTNRRTYHGRQYLWTGFVSHFHALTCSLVCINEMNMVVIRSPIAVDGTPCKSGELDVCIQGTCRHVGCDYVIDSNAKQDLCGQCHGKGTECKIVRGEFDEPNLKGMIHILCLPVGTTMIFIREKKPSDCLLVVTSSVNSTKYLNEDPSNPELPGNIWIAGTQSVYNVKGGIERLLIKGPIKVPIAVKYYCEESSCNGGIYYQYALPESDPTYLPTYKWRFLYWEECSDLCGGGSQRAVPICLEELNGEVDDKYCNPNLKPKDVIRPCNPFPCQARWWIGPWSDCDCDDGEGIMVRSIICTRSRNLFGSFALVVREKECCGQPKPPTERPCNYTKKIELLEKIIMNREKRKLDDDKEQYEGAYYDGDIELYDENNANIFDNRIVKRKISLHNLNQDQDHDPNELTPNPITILPFKNLKKHHHKAVDNAADEGYFHKNGLFGSKIGRRIPGSVISFKKAKPRFSTVIHNATDRNMGSKDPKFERANSMPPQMLVEGITPDILESAKFLKETISVPPDVVTKKDNVELVKVTFKDENSNNQVFPAVEANQNGNTLLQEGESEQKEGPSNLSPDKATASLTVSSSPEPKNVVQEMEVIHKKACCEMHSTTEICTRPTYPCQTQCPPPRKSSKCSKEMIKSLTKEIVGCRTTRKPKAAPVAVDCPIRVDLSNTSSNKIILVPISHPKVELEQTDAEFQAFGMNALPIANETKPLVLSGEVLFGTLDNVRKHTTKLPVIRNDEVD